MTKMGFLRLPPIVIVMNGVEYLLKPRALPSGRCVFQSDPLEEFVPTGDGGTIRVNGTFTLNPYRSKTWEPK